MMILNFFVLKKLINLPVFDFIITCFLIKNKNKFLKLMKINCTLIILLILINYTNQVPYDPDKALDILYYAKVA